MIKVLQKYSFVFSPQALAAFLAQELPYLPWLLHPPSINPLAHNGPATPLLGVLEQAGGIITIAVLILVSRKGYKPNCRSRYMAGALICLAVYYACWICYFAGITNGWMIVIGLTAVVPIYYLFIALWLKNPFAVMSSLLFFVGHTTSNAINFLL